MKIASLLIYDARRSLCARIIDVIIPDAWDACRVLAESTMRLPPGTQLVTDDPERVQFFDMDDEPVFGNWAEPMEFALCPC